MLVLEDLDQISEREYVDPYHMALFLDALDRRDDAIAELTRACEENSSMLHMMDTDPKLDGIRSDARFASLRERASGRLREAAVLAG
jgi:hypothetical protein